MPPGSQEEAVLQIRRAIMCSLAETFMFQSETLRETLFIVTLDGDMALLLFV
jgi:hypothetical protein